MSTCSATCWPRQEQHSKAWVQLGSQTNSSLSRFSPGLIGCRPRSFPFFSCPTSDRGKPAVEERGGAPFHLRQATWLPSPTQTRPRSPTPSSHCFSPPTPPPPCAPRPLPLLRHPASRGHVAGLVVHLPAHTIPLLGAPPPALRRPPGCCRKTKAGPPPVSASRGRPVMAGPPVQDRALGSGFWV